MVGNRVDNASFDRVRSAIQDDALHPFVTPASASIIGPIIVGVYEQSPGDAHRATPINPAKVHRGVPSPWLFPASVARGRASDHGRGLRSPANDGRDPGNIPIDARPPCSSRANPTRDPARRARVAGLAERRRDLRREGLAPERHARGLHRDAPPGVPGAPVHLPGLVPVVLPGARVLCGAVRPNSLATSNVNCSSRPETIIPTRRL